MQNTPKTAFSETGGAKSGALSPAVAPFESDLQRVIDAWPSLPEPLRQEPKVGEDGVFSALLRRLEETVQQNQEASLRAFVVAA